MVWQRGRNEVWSGEGEGGGGLVRGKEGGEH